jgi:hypothetical protein
VNPDKELARVAREEGWPCLRFDRLRTKLRFATSAALATAAGGVGSALLMRRRSTRLAPGRS